MAMPSWWPIPPIKRRKPPKGIGGKAGAGGE